jgi:hypothetical protein
VVDVIDDEDTDILVEAAKKYKKTAKPGDIIEIPLDTKNFGRIDAQTAKHVIRQGIRDAERGRNMEEFKTHNQEIVTARVSNINPMNGNATVEIGRAEAVLPKGEQIPGEELHDGDLLHIGAVEVRCLFVPGHCPGSICYVVPDDKAVITGDALFCGSIGRTDLPGGNHQELIANLKAKVMTLPDDYRVLPGHEGSSTIADEKKYNPFL